jgi:ubiquinone/menaquinone biosynthesis C-methylase UbiE
MKSPSKIPIDPEAERAAERLSSISGGKVLDVATGDGTFIKTLMKTLKDYESFVGVDISEKEFESAREGFKEDPVEILMMDADSLEFEDEYFDIVGISYSLHHLLAMDGVLEEMKRVLKPGGHFIVMESYRDGDQTEAQRTEILTHHWGAEIDNLKGIPHRKTLSRDEIKEVLESLGLKDTEVFDSVQSVNCLLCDKWSICSDPMNKEGIRESIAGIERKLGDLQEMEDSGIRSRLVRRGEELMERTRKTGISPACNLFFVGRK